jgi:tRNA-specific 2-thiouridylase
VGGVEALGQNCVSVHSLNWLGDTTLDDKGLRVSVKVRSTKPPVAATVFASDNNTARVILDEPQQGISPGQACVMYDGTRVLGGGWIGRV